ncbi:MAG: NADP-dependent glyceraldehyde-3-phosphate dehydrogenase [Fimbriimonadaceae bacterium]|nr:NADP-dependent glyceraldehyde-3-phosphate dehydrogenase [Fimbriimonadaceae bacterium]
MDVRHAELLINGTFLGGPCDGAIGKSQSYSPYDGKLVGIWAEAGWGECDAAIASSVEAGRSWRCSTGKERADLLARISRRLHDDRSLLAELMALEVGKPISMGLAEVDRAVHTFALAAGLATESGATRQDLSYDERGLNYHAEVIRQPRGVLLGITPYNWPVNLAAHKIAPALAGGNTVVLKGSGQAGLCSLTLARLIHECDCPHGVLNAVQCASPLAEKMALDPRIDAVSFTGSPKVGWHLKELLPRKHVTLELGGDAFAVVDESADLEAACKRIAFGAFGYAGQICIKVQHVLVHRSRYEDAKAILRDLTEATPIGDPRDPSTVCGPVISSDAADRIEEWVAEATAAGAEILAGGNRIGNVIEPTLMAQCPETVRLGCDEVFGPVLTLDPFDDFNQALDRVNHSRYGIHAGVFSIREDRIEASIERLQVVGVVINDVPTVRFDSLPYGGVKNSGFGLEGVRFAYEELTQPKSVVRRISG